jgi:hypothetical protein
VLALLVKRTPAHVPTAEEAWIELSLLEAHPAETTEPTAETTEPAAENREPSSGARETPRAAEARATGLSYEAQRARIRAQLDDPSPPGAHAGTPRPPGGKDVPVGPLDSRDGYEAIRAQIAGWDRRLITGTYKPGGSRIAHPDPMPSQRIPPEAPARRGAGCDGAHRALGRRPSASACVR